MTDQPRDLAAEVEFGPDSIIAAIVKQLRDSGKSWADIDVDLRNEMTADWRKRIEHYAGLHIAALSRELEERKRWATEWHKALETAAVVVEAQSNGSPSEVVESIRGRFDLLQAEIARLRAENERLIKDLAHWKDCHGVTADSLAAAESELAALRRPVVDTYIVQGFWSPCRKYIVSVQISNGQLVAVQDDGGDVWEPTGPAQDMCKVTL